jgi:membrane protease YdiL (CAAX protease family)
LSASAGLYLLASGPLELDAGSLGLTHLAEGEVAAAVGAGAALTLPLFVALLHGRASSALADERVRGLWGGRLVYQALVRVPLGTAVLEELAFRGVLLALWADMGDVHAVVASSVAFGLWHISPTITLVRANHPDAARRRTVTTVIGAVAIATGAGIVLAGLMLASDSLYVPFALHATVNSLATIAGAVAHRRADQLA